MFPCFAPLETICASPQTCPLRRQAQRSEFVHQFLWGTSKLLGSRPFLDCAGRKMRAIPGQRACAARHGASLVLVVVIVATCRWVPRVCPLLCSYMRCCIPAGCESGAGAPEGRCPAGCSPGGGGAAAACRAPCDTMQRLPATGACRQHP